MGIEEKADSIESYEKKNAEKKKESEQNDDEIARLSTEYEELRKRDNLDNEIEKIDLSKLVT